MPSLKLSLLNPLAMTCKHRQDRTMFERKCVGHLCRQSLQAWQTMAPKPCTSCQTTDAAGAVGATAATRTSTACHLDQKAWNKHQSMTITTAKSHSTWPSQPAAHLCEVPLAGAPVLLIVLSRSSKVCKLVYRTARPFAASCGWLEGQPLVCHHPFAESCRELQLLVFAQTATAAGCASQRQRREISHPETYQYVIRCLKHLQKEQK